MKMSFPKVPPDLTSSYMGIYNAFEKYVSKFKPNSEDLPDSPDTLPAFAHDTCNYVARYGIGNFQIQAIMKLDGELDFDKLSRAVRLSVEAEPVLGCRFVEGNPPYWKRREDIDKVAFCSMEVTCTMEEAIHKFLESPLDMDDDPMVKVKLIRGSEHDTLGIKINHTCSDGAGLKDYISLLSQIYTCIDTENGIYEPKPSKRSREDHKKAFDTLGIKHPELDMSTVEAPKTVWPFPWKPAGHKDIPSYAICQLPQGELDILSRYAKERGVTINDIILTAFYRAMFKMSQPLYGIPMDIGLTIDLRRYIPGNKAEAIRNFSGGIMVSLARLMNEPFEGTLSRIATFMKRKKKENFGYQNATAAERIEKLGFYNFLNFVKFTSQASKPTSQNCFFCSPGLSNVGILSKSLIKFGDRVVTEAFIIPPVIRAPGFLLVVSSYNGIMTLSVGYQKGSVSDKYLEKLLNRIKYEIESCIR